MADSVSGDPVRTVLIIKQVYSSWSAMSSFAVPTHGRSSRCWPLPVHSTLSCLRLWFESRSGILCPIQLWTQCVHYLPPHNTEFVTFPEVCKWSRVPKFQESATTTHFKMSGERCRKNLFQMKKNDDFTRIHLPIAVEWHLFLLLFYTCIYGKSSTPFHSLQRWIVYAPDAYRTSRLPPLVGLY